QHRAWREFANVSSHLTDSRILTGAPPFRGRRMHLLRRHRTTARRAKLPAELQLGPASQAGDDREVLPAMRAEGDATSRGQRAAAVAALVADLWNDRVA